GPAAGAAATRPHNGPRRGGAQSQGGSYRAQATVGTRRPRVCLSRLRHYGSAPIVHSKSPPLHSKIAATMFLHGWHSRNLAARATRLILASRYARVARQTSLARS